MKTHALLRLGALTGLFLLGASLNLPAQVPQLLHYQGRAIVSNTNFDGTGQFKFALVNGAGTVTYWSNDGSSTTGNEPSSAISLPVSKGLYATLLGENMTPVPASVFANTDVRLRVWFNGGPGFQLVSPDQRIAAVGYAMKSATVDDGAITAAKLAPGAVDNVPVSSLVASLNHVIAWGDNSSGQTTVPPDLSTVITVRAGEWHSLALKSDGTVVAWGENSLGQTEIPAGLKNVVAIAGGQVHSLALRSDGTVVAWGDNGYDQTSIPPGLNNVVAVAAARFYNLALKSDGTVVSWGFFGNLNPPAGLDHVTAVAAGASHCLALKNDGTVVAWGGNDFGQATVPVGLNGVVALAGGGAHSLALKSDGTVMAWGLNNSGQTNVPTGLNGIIAIAAGYDFSLALKSDGSVVAWGGGPGTGVTDIPPTANHVVKLAAGSAHCLALRIGNEPAHVPLLDVPNIFTGASTFNNPANRFTGNGEGLSGLYASSLLPGQVVKSLNSLKDNVNLVAGPNIIITPSGNNLQIAGTAGGLAASGTPQEGAVVTATDGGGHAMWQPNLKVLDVNSILGIKTTHSVNLIGGYNNAVGNGAIGATVLGGGQMQESSLRILSSSSNYVGANYATVIGGYYNVAVGDNSVVSGGANNQADGFASFVSGGQGNLAHGAYSFAAGRNAKANYSGNFVWADSQSDTFDATANDQFLIRAGGGVGVNTATPTATLDVNGSGHFAGTLAIDTSNGRVQFTDDVVPGLQVTGGTIPGTLRFRDALEVWSSQDGSREGKIDVRNTSGEPTITLRGSGVATVKVLEITGGADVAEPFPIEEQPIEPGSVVVIDDENPGRLKLSRHTYDTRVAGVVSGANGVRPGLALRQEGVIEGGQNVALSGRVFMKVDATDSAIKPGDLITTSDTPGHGMKATDLERRSGAILGKAMTPLRTGKGMVLVLVTLQ